MVTRVHKHYNNYTGVYKTNQTLMNKCIVTHDVILSQNKLTMFLNGFAHNTLSIYAYQQVTIHQLWIYHIPYLLAW